jgi:hypothetical protein
MPSACAGVFKVVFAARKVAFIAFLATLSMSLGGCSKQQPAARSMACFPAEAARWIWDDRLQAQGSQQAHQGDVTPGTAATIYVDRSASMVGYLQGASQFERPLQDLLGNLPTLLRAQGAQPSFRAFGKTITSPLKDGAKSFDTMEMFRCAREARENCESAESHLDMVLNQVATQDKGISIILTDLWYDNSAEQTSGMTALQEPLTSILASGRTIAVYGIAAPFDGKIYDVPANATKTMMVSYKGRHPLFMLAIGSKAQIIALGEQLEKSGSKLISSGVTTGNIRRSLFTVDPGPLYARVKAPLAPGTHAGLRQATFESYQGPSVQQFVLEGRLNTADLKQARTPPSWTAPAQNAFLPAAVWEGPLEPRLQLYERRDEACKPASWIKRGDIGLRWQSVPGSGQHRLDLDPVHLNAHLTRKGVYLLSGQLERTSVTTPNPANAWMVQWSLSPEAAAVVAARKPAVFPTLNLSEVSRIMENALATAAERKGGGVVGFSVLINRT